MQGQAVCIFIFDKVCLNKSTTTLLLPLHKLHIHAVLTFKSL